jgi:hypothetical protein
MFNLSRTQIESLNDIPFNKVKDKITKIVRKKVTRSVKAPFINESLMAQLVDQAVDEYASTNSSFQCYLIVSALVKRGHQCQIEDIDGCIKISTIA